MAWPVIVMQGESLNWFVRQRPLLFYPQQWYTSEPFAGRAVTGSFELNKAGNDLISRWSSLFFRCDVFNRSRMHLPEQNKMELDRSWNDRSDFARRGLRLDSIRGRVALA